MDTGWQAMADRPRVRLWCFALGLPLRLRGWLNPDGVCNGNFYTGAWLPWFKTHVSWARAPRSWSEGAHDREQALLLAEAHPGLSRSFERKVMFSLSSQVQVARGIPFVTHQLILGRWAFWISPDPYMPDKLPEDFMVKAEARTRHSDEARPENSPA